MLTKFLGTLSAMHFGQSAWAEQILENIAPANDAQPNCEEQPFCDRFRNFMDHADLRNASDVYYGISADSVNFDVTKGEITAELNLASSSDGTVSQTLDLTMNVY